MHFGSCTFRFLAPVWKVSHFVIFAWRLVCWSKMLTKFNLFLTHYFIQMIWKFWLFRVSFPQSCPTWTYEFFTSRFLENQKNQAMLIVCYQNSLSLFPTAKNYPPKNQMDVYCSVLSVNMQSLITDQFTSERIEFIKICSCDFNSKVENLAKGWTSVTTWEDVLSSWVYLILTSSLQNCKRKWITWIKLRYIDFSVSRNEYFISFG